MFYVAYWGTLGTQGFWYMKSPKELLQTMLSKVGDGSTSATVDILKELITIQLDEAGTLSKRIGDGKKLAISRMKVIGALDSSDVKCLRNMPQLEMLDLTDARIVTGGCYYIEAWYCQNEEDMMGLYMFHRNAKLRSILFPKGVLAVRPMAFRRCSSLSEVVFSPVLERIDDRAFSYCDSLEQVSFPPVLKTIGARAFSHCKSLKMIQCESVINIGGYAFSDCPSLSSVNFGSALQNIGDMAFAGTALTSVCFPASLKEMGTDVFKECRLLTAIHMSSSVPPFAKSDTFEGMNTDACTLFVPKGAKNNYWLANGWEKFKNIVEK